MIRRESNVRSAIVRAGIWSSSLNRAQYFDPTALDQRGRSPLRTRHDLPVERHRHAASLLGSA
jgi:hypothetical protein